MMTGMRAITEVSPMEVVVELVVMVVRGVMVPSLGMAKGVMVPSLGMDR